MKVLGILPAIVLMFVPLCARADDFGAHGAVSTVRSNARRLLARRVRQSGAQPENVPVSDVVVAGDQALLSWNSGKQHGIMGLVVQNDRWWDALDMTFYSGCWYRQTAFPLVPTTSYPDAYAPPSFMRPPTPETLANAGMHRDLVAAAGAHNTDVRNSGASRSCSGEVYAVSADVRFRNGGGTIHPPVRAFTSGYDFTVTYSPNDATPDARLTRFFARPPTQAEFAPSHAPAPGWGGPDAVCYFDLEAGGSKPIAFAAGTIVDVWFPFVLDDQLRYNLSFFSAGKSSGMIFGTIFDNTLHFMLPAFTLVPGQALMAEIDGDIKGSR